MTRPEIFLSYNREDQAVARRFAEGFGREGFNVWWDQTLRSGEAYDEVTEGALREAKAVVVLWSKKSVVSRWVRAEATLADRNRTLVPAMIEACERPIMFELTQTADLSKWGGDANDRSWLTFLTDVRRFVGERATASTAATTLPPQAAHARSSVTDGRPSLAILPFTNRSGERADDVFADGMVEDLISALSLNSGIKVIAQSATVTYRKNVSDLHTIGRELAVRYLLEGNVRRVGSSLRVTAQLVEAGNGAILWTQKFDRPLTELAELQEQLVVEVAGQLGVQVERVEIEKALKKPGDLTAWEAVMRSFVGLVDFNRDNVRLCIAEARKAVAIAPDYALGHGVLACLLSYLYALTGGGDRALAAEVRMHAQRALSLAPDDPAILGFVARAVGNCGAWEEALTHLQRAIELNPNLAESQASMAQVCIRFDRPEDALSHMDIAEKLAPRGSANIFNGVARAYAHYQAGRYEQGLEVLRKSLLAMPGLSIALNAVAAFCEKLGRHEEAHTAIRRLRESNPTLTLNEIQAFNVTSWLSPKVSAETNELLAKAWAETSVETRTA